MHQEHLHHVTVYFRDILKDAVASVHRRFPHHTITDFKETGHEEVLERLRKETCWHGYYDHWPLAWEFVLEKQDPDAPGPSRCELLVNPIFDHIFKGFEDVVMIEVTFHNGPRTIKVAGTDALALDALVFYELEDEDDGSASD